MSGGALGSAASAPAPAGPMTGQPGFAAGEMRPNGRKGRGGNGSRVWEKRKVPRFRGADYGICRWRYFLSVKKVTKERRGFAVGAPARRSRDGNGKTSAPVGPMTGQPGFAAGEMRPNGSKGRGGNGSRVWEKRKVPRFRGADCEICRWRYFLSVKKVTKEHRGRSVRLKNHDFKFRIKS